MKLKARLLNRCTKLSDILQALLQDLRRDTTQLALDPHVAEDLDRLLEKRLGKIQQAVEVLKLQVEQRDEAAMDKTLTDALVDIQESCYRLQENIRNDSCKKLPPIKHFECLIDAVRNTILDQLQTMVRYASLRYFLPGEPEPDAKVLQLAEQLKQEQQLADKTPSFSEALQAVKELGVKPKAKVRCFISYAWASEDRPWEQWVQLFLKTLCKHLKLAGVEVYLDIDNSLEGFNSHHHMDRIADCRYVILVGTESLLDKFNLGVSSVCYELNLIRQRRRIDAENGLYKVIPLIVSGTIDTALPADFERFTVIKTCGGQYVATLKDLIRQLYDYGTHHPGYLSTWQTLATQHRDWFTQNDTHGFADLPIDSVTPNSVVPLPLNHNTVDALPTDWRSVLKARYSAQRFIPSLFAQESVVTQGLPIENYYVNLALITEQEQQQKEKAQKAQESKVDRNQIEVAQDKSCDLSATDFIPTESPSHEQLFAVQTPLELTELFNMCDKANDTAANASHHLLLLGGAGIGKSTLCQYIAYQWAQGQLWSDRYDGVIWLRLRDLNDTYFPVNREYSLEEIIARLVFGCKDTNLIPGFDHLMQQVKANKARFLFLLDGYDELPTFTQKNQWHSSLKELFSFPEVIVTSRPQPIQYYQPNLAVQVVGFTDANIDTYIQQFFSAHPQKLNQLQHFLKEQAIIKSLLHIPINAGLFCQLWQSDELKEAELSFTELYQHITQWLFKRNLTKQGINITQIPNAELENYCGHLPLYLEHLAWQAMQAEKIYLPESFISQAIKQVDEKRESQAKIPTENLTTQLQGKLIEILGLAQQLNHPELFSHLVQSLNCLNINSAQPKLNSYDELRLHSGFLRSTSTQVREFYFMHLSFQEFFAARYAARIIQKASNQDNADYEAFQTFFKANKFNPKLQVVWWFIAGLLKDDSKALDRYFHLLLQQPHDILVFNEIPLFMHCLEQSNLAENSYVGKKILDKLSLHISTLIENKLPELSLRNKNLLSHIKLNTNFLRKNILFPWIKNLEKSDISAKRLAVKILKKLDDEVAILAQVDKHTAEKIMTNFGLIELLQDADIGGRDTAINVLNTLGDKVDAEPVVEKLLDLLKCPEWERKETAARTLSQLGRRVATKNVLLDLLRCLKEAFNDTSYNDKNYIFRIAVNQLCKELSFSEVNDFLLSLLSDSNWQKQQIAVKLLGHFGEKAANQQVLDQLLNLLKHPKSELQLAVANTLGELGKNAATSQVIEELLNLLKSKEYSVKAASAKTLIKLKIESTYSEVYNCLLNLLKEECLNGQDLRLAPEILNQIKANLPMDNLINHLSNLLKNPEVRVQKAVIKAIGILGENAATDKIIQELLNILNNSNEYSLKALVIEALGKLGKQAATLNVLETILKHVYATPGDKLYSLDNIKIALSSICAKLTFSKVYRVLSKLLSSPNWQVQQIAVEILSQFNEKTATEELLNRFLQLLKKSNISLKISIYKALSKFGEQASKVEIINYLLEDTKNSSLELREAAIIALGELAKKADALKVIRGLSDYLHGVSNKPRYKMSAVKYILKKTLIKLVNNSSISKALKLLFEMLKDSDARISEVLTDVLIEFEAQLPAVTSIEELSSMLEDVKWWRRESAIIILGHLGEKAAGRKVIDKLFYLLKDKDYIQRKLIAKALGQLGSTIKEASLTKEVINWLQALQNDTRVNVHTTASTALEHICKKIDKDALFKIIKDAPNSLASYLIGCLFSQFVAAPLIIENNCLTWYEFNRGRVSIRLEKAVLEKLKKVSNERVIRNFKNINFLFQQAPYVESAVLQALSEGNLPLIETTLAHDASLLNLLTENNESLTIHVFQLTISQAFEIQKLVLSYRPFVSLEQLNQLLENDFLFHYQDNRESKAQNLHLIEKIISTLIGISNFNQKAHSERLQVLAYALDINLDNQSHQARGLFAEDYLLFRLAYYLQLLGKLVNGTITPNQYPHGLDKKSLAKSALIALVKREMLLVWEALRLHEEWQCVTYPSQNYTKEQIAELWDCHALSLINKLKGFSEGEELIYPTGYEGHCIYVVFTRRRDKIIGRVDNLLEADIKNRHQKDAKGYKPFLLGEWLIDEQLGGSHCSLKCYLTEGLFLAKSRRRDEALELIYRQAPQENNQTLISWPSLPVQSRDNCVVKGFQLGLLCRSVSEDEFKFLEEEHAKLWVSAIINPIPINNSTSSPILVAPNNDSQRAMGLASKNTQNKQKIILRTIEKAEKPRIDFDTPLLVQKIIAISKVINVQQTNSVLPTTYPSPISQPANTNNVMNNNNNPLHVEASDSDLEPDNQSRYLVM